jgi:hypothetical protein
MLGVPLGSGENVSVFVEERLIGRAKDVMQKLSGFEDTQSALFLLHLSFASVRAVHFMRTTPLLSWSKQAADFDRLVRVTAEKILGCPRKLVRGDEDLWSASTFCSQRIFPKPPSISSCTLKVQPSEVGSRREGEEGITRRTLKNPKEPQEP